MAKDLNQWHGIGRLGNDPEIRYMPNGSAVANLSIACGDDYKDKDGNKVERTEWIRMVAFGKLAEIIEKYVKKGSKIYAEGKFTTRQWEKDGAKHYSTEIVLSNMQMLDSKPQDGSQQQGNQSRPAQNNQQSQQQPQPPASSYSAHDSRAPNIDDFDDDIPF